ncbi:hypothetical protein AB0N38_26120 [Micromonospora aurantiaca]|uniref:hypothetical protein n=1 Tax=Micromonospora aurantiaca (nom. illeg.) TaxID=47850 RepID=UPI003429692F
MNTNADPLAGWKPCSTAGCPLSDPDAPEPDDIDDMRDTGMAHGVRHVDISDHWWVPTANANDRVLAVAEWLARHEGRDYCIRGAEHAGEWRGYQLLASDLLRAVDNA